MREQMYVWSGTCGTEAAAEGKGLEHSAAVAAVVAVVGKQTHPHTHPH